MNRCYFTRVKSMLSKIKTVSFFIILCQLFSCTTSNLQLGFSEIQVELTAISRLSTKVQPKKIIEVMELNPIFSEKIIKYLLETKIVPNKTINIIAQSKKISIQKILTSIADKPNVLTPLYHSASITIRPEVTSQKYQLKYKSENDLEWSNPVLLDYEPNSGAFSASIVNLSEDTLYEVRILSLQDPNYLDVAQFTTKGTVHFSAGNTYKLSAIYSGGVLDLVKLKISGSENNWVKIVGDSYTVISTTDAVNSAINIGSNSYIYFENIIINGGGRHAISSNKAHHIRFNGCNISNWGRATQFVSEGKPYANKGDSKPINYDSAFSLVKTGVVTIENCHVHSPRSKSNSWRHGHPNGPNALLVDAGHPNKSYQGQIVIRNNRFYGEDRHRFNDVIETKSNDSPFGGFVRDSAIYSNYLAYANDDIIEIDGNQMNVLVYDNEIEQGYCGISAIPNRQGPSYIFNNYIHNLGDENQSSWAAIKLGGLVSRPGGKVNIFNNIIKTKSNGIASAKYMNDSTFWADVWSNIIISNDYKTGAIGYSIIEKMPFSGNRYNNNFVFNSIMKKGFVKVKFNRIFAEKNHNHVPVTVKHIQSRVTLPGSYRHNYTIKGIITNRETMIIGLTGK